MSIKNDKSKTKNLAINDQSEMSYWEGSSQKDLKNQQEFQCQSSLEIFQGQNCSAALSSWNNLPQKVKVATLSLLIAYTFLFIYSVFILGIQNIRHTKAKRLICKRL